MTGRFCQWSHMLHRGLPPVTECGLWNALADQPPAEQSYWNRHSILLATAAGQDVMAVLIKERQHPYFVSSKLN